MSMNRKKQDLFFKQFVFSFGGTPGVLNINQFEQVIDQQLDIHRGTKLISCVPVVKDGNTTEIILIFDSGLKD